MTKQEIFDTVAIHLIKQGKQSADASGACFYRSPDGLKCAVGCLIPDEVYRPKMEGRSISTLFKNFSELNFLQPSVGLLNDIQRVHDNTYSEGQIWTDAVVLRLRKIAEKYNLSTTMLDT
jgi:hypothetical protein